MIDYKLCLICERNKKVDLFTGNLTICEDCINRTDSKNRRANKDNKKKLIKVLDELKEKNNVDTVATDLIDIDFKETSISELEECSLLELESIIIALKAENNSDSIPNEKTIIDIDKILCSYIDFTLRDSPEYYDNWRDFIPIEIKSSLKKIESVSMAKARRAIIDYLPHCNNSRYNELDDYIKELSRILSMNNIYANDDPVKIEEHITILIESIMLPFFEVQDMIEMHEGNYKIKSTTSASFTKKVELQIKNRDKWQCVICKDKNNLKIHHKIPLNLGGTNLEENLVTLCNSCKDAVETNDIKKAINICTNNFRNYSFNIRK